MDSLTTFTRETDKYPDNYNAKMMSKYGLDLCRGLQAFALADFESAYQILRPLRFDWLQSMSGSRAQVDILNQVLIQCAIKAGFRTDAKNLLKERWAYCAIGLKATSGDEENGVDLLNQRLNAKIQAMM